MTDLRLLTQNGLQYYAPRDVKQAQKACYWLMTGQLLARDDPAFAENAQDVALVKERFAALSLEKRHEILLQQRHWLRYRMNRNFVIEKPEENALIRLNEGPLPLSFIRDDMFDVTAPQEWARLSERENTSYSHTKPHIAALFSESDRIFLPLQQSDDEQESMSDMMMVLSRHPYDLARMSTGRHWYSCMHAQDVNLRKFLPRDIKHGTIAAYLVKGVQQGALNADWNIDNPKARCLFKPYAAKDGTVIYQRDKIYGMTSWPFRRTADTLCREWLSIEAKPGQEYDIAPKLYMENITSTVRIQDMRLPERRPSAWCKFAENMVRVIPGAQKLADTLGLGS